MPEILTRAGKGSDLTPTQADSNFKRTVNPQTGTYTTLSTDNRNLIECSHATVAFTVTLLAVATASAVDTGDYEVTIFNIGAAIVSVDGNASEPINGSVSVVTLHQWESATFKLNNAGTGYNTVSSAPLAKNYPRVYQAKQATTSGTTIDFTGIPSWATRLTILYNLVSADATTIHTITLGDSGGFETSGYLSYVMDRSSATSNASSFLISPSIADTVAISGAITLNLYDSSTFEWVQSGIISIEGNVGSSAGTKTLSSALTQVRISTSNSATFDAGSVRLIYE